MKTAARPVIVPILAFAFASALLVCACEQRPEPPPPQAPHPHHAAPTEPAAPKQSGEPAKAPGAQAPAGKAPEAKSSDAAPSAAPGFTVAGLRLTVPEGWEKVPPSNTMRLAELRVPGAGEPCVVAISTAGGDVAANIARWAGQVKDSAGKAPEAAPTVREIAGFKVHQAEFTGTYTGMGEGPARPEWTLRGAIVETPGGLVFIKMTGPAPAMRAAREGWDRMIEGMGRP